MKIPQDCASCSGRYSVLLCFEGYIQNVFFLTYLFHIGFLIFPIFVFSPSPTFLNVFFIKVLRGLTGLGKNTMLVLLEIHNIYWHTDTYAKSQFISKMSNDNWIHLSGIFTNTYRICPHFVAKILMNILLKVGSVVTDHVCVGFPNEALGSFLWHRPSKGSVSLSVEWRLSKCSLLFVGS